VNLLALGHKEDHFKSFTIESAAKAEKQMQQIISFSVSFICEESFRAVNIDNDKNNNHDWSKL
jgi:hypothetical protein